MTDHLTFFCLRATQAPRLRSFTILVLPRDMGFGSTLGRRPTCPDASRASASLCSRTSNRVVPAGGIRKGSRPESLSLPRTCQSRRKLLVSHCHPGASDDSGCFVPKLRDLRRCLVKSSP